MPLDPMIANPVPIKINDPMEQYGAYLKNAFLMDEIDKAREERQNNAFLGESLRETGGDVNATTNSLAKKGAGKAYLAYQKHNAEIAEKGAQTKKHAADVSKTNEETLGKRFENARTLLDSVSPDPKVGVKQMENWLLGQHKDPMIAEFFASHGVTPESSLKELNDAVQSGKFQDFLLANRSTLTNLAKQNYITEDLGGHKRIVAMPENALGVPQPRVVSDQKVTESPNRQKQVINVGVTNQGPKAGNKFTETVAEGRGNDFLAMEKAVRAGRGQVARIDEALRLLNDGAFVGALGNPAMDVTRYAKALGFNVNDKKLTNSQELRKLLKQGMLDYLAALKASGTTMNPFTDADARRLEATLANETDDADTIRGALMMQRKIAQDVEQQYLDYARQHNENPMTSGGMGATNPPAQPRIPGIPASMDLNAPAAAIEHLRKNPKLAPQFDAKYGAGAAARVLGGSPTGGTPFPGAGVGR